MHLIQIFFSLYPAGINIVSIPLTRLRATNFEIKKHPVPFVKPGKQKQLFFLNFNIDGKTLSGNDRVRMLKKSKKIAIRK